MALDGMTADTALPRPPVTADPTPPMAEPILVTALDAILSGCVKVMLMGASESFCL